MDGDGDLDLYLAQNYFGPQRETGRMDGGVGLLLLGRGDGTFDPVWPNRSGLVVTGDAKSVTTADVNGDGNFNALDCQGADGTNGANGLDGENGGDGEMKKAVALKEYLKKAGFPEPAEYDAPDSRVTDGKRPNLVYLINGQDTSKTVWVMAHTDIVPPGDLAKWDGDPYAMRVDGDTIYGRGVEDNQHGLVAGVIAARAFIDLKIKPKFNVGLLFVADEEVGHGAAFASPSIRHAIHDETADAGWTDSNSKLRWQAASSCWAQGAWPKACCRWRSVRGSGPGTSGAARSGWPRRRPRATTSPVSSSRCPSRIGGSST